MIRPPFKYHGGKYYLAKDIIKLMPTHDVYVEPFLGAGSVLLNKKPAKAVTVASDINEDLICFWRTLQNSPEQLISDLTDLTYCEETFLSHSSLPRHLRIFVKHRMSRGSMGNAYSWSERLRGGQPECLNSWETAIKLLSEISRRIQDVNFHTSNAIDICRDYCGDQTLIYCDPPYVPETRISKSVYEHEMTVDDHADLLEFCNTFAGTVILSGRECPLYDKELKKWLKIVIHYPSHSGQSKEKKTTRECVWIKYSKTFLNSVQIF